MNSNQQHKPEAQILHDPNNIYGKGNTPLLKKQTAKDILRSRLYYFFLIMNGTFAFYFVSSLLSLYNTMQNQIQIVYGWSDSQATLYFSIVNSITDIGALAAGIFIAIFTTRIGRRTQTIIFTVIVFIGSVFTLIVNTPLLIFGRFLHGLTLGAANTLGPLYIREFSPAEYKGKTGVALIICFRISQFITFALGFGLPKVQNSTANSSFENNYWRIMLSIPMVVGLMQLIGFCCFFTYDTPTYVFNKTQDSEKTLHILEKIYTRQRAQHELNNIINLYQQSQSKEEVGLKNLFVVYKKQMILGLLMAFTFQVSGIDTLFVFSNQIIDKAGENSIATLFTSLGAIIDLMGVFTGFFLIERTKRKSLFLFSHFCVTVCCACFGIFGYLNCKFMYKYVIIVMRYSFSMGIGSVFWSYIPDIVPLMGITVIIFVFNFGSFVVLILFLPMLDLFDVEGTFLIYAGISAICFIILTFLMKETKGLSKDQVQRLFSNLNQQVSQEDTTTYTDELSEQQRLKQQQLNLVEGLSEKSSKGSKRNSIQQVEIHSVNNL